MCLWPQRIRPTVSPTLEFIPQLPIPAGVGTVPLRSVTRSLSSEDVVLMCPLSRQTSRLISASEGPRFDYEGNLGGGPERVRNLAKDA